MNKAKVNYWTDMGIGVAGLISAISGLAFLLPGDPTTGLLGISYQVLNAVHTWSSLAAIRGTDWPPSCSLLRCGVLLSPGDHYSDKPGNAARPYPRDPRTFSITANSSFGLKGFSRKASTGI